ncbi:MAG: ADP-ribosylglycohydrolase family protein [Desulfohalobiaceae bacterium]
MLGAIIGDIIGSRFEARPIKSTDFELFTSRCSFTDDSVLTIAVADSLLQGAPYSQKLKEYYQRYPWAGFGGSFQIWAASDSKEPYNSLGNGSAMRVSPVAWYYNQRDQVLQQAEGSAAATHNHPEGIKGAQAVALSIHLARQGADKSTIKQEISQGFGYNLDRSLEDIRPGYSFDVTCPGSVPEALICFLEAQDFEQAIRNAVSLGGDSDTQACIAGSVAEAFFQGVPQELREQGLGFLDDFLQSKVEEFLKTMDN